ncbi:TonB-dependent receptor domain-containing protein [Aliarcobacter butzleri]|uniref:TonB-dependent receptor domain-containing protein n=1 Tax=Aliarcobacter butzleri TaxID=28197 RepID=UPI00263E6AE8|nr:TonB-dependent receptor [Aliarcobacter butzleri]MDN5080179.1 TonB-dependent receptor [Aliarcobacter butzleri]MDN5081966.1 TonB-dependent receptor [Aliarcobacter butzleri]MDN5084276.1 TonB-dependent receptor [Aliarcobacter butzleri]
MKKIKIAKSLAILLVTGTHYLSANEATILDEVQVVTSASGYEQKITDAPASISVITQEDLSKKPYNNLLDAVKDIEGVDIGETNDKTNNGQVSIRGMGADYTLLLIDGKRQNNNGDLYPNSFGGVQWASIPPLSMIERIEVVRGPMSTLYGSDAMGGVINIITKKISKEWTGSIGYAKTFQTESDYGNDDKVDFSIMGPLIQNKLGLRLSGSFFDVEKSNPEYGKAYDKNGVDVSKGNDSFGAGKGNVKHEDWTFGTGLTFTPNDNHTIRANFDVAKQKYDNQPYLTKSGTKVDPLGTNDTYSALLQQRAGYKDELRFEREQYSLDWEANWDLGKTIVGIHHVDTNNNGRTLPPTLDEREYLKNKGYLYSGSNVNSAANQAKLAAAMQDPVFLAMLPRPDRPMQSKNTTYSAKYELPLNEHFLVVGTEYQDSELKDGVFGMEDGGTPNTIKKYYQYALYAEDNWNITDPLTFTVGARYNKHEDFGDYTTPRAYLTYMATDNWTFKGGVSTGYKAPKATDLYDGITGFGSQGANPMIGNPDLKPEKSVSYEVAAYYEHEDKHNFNVTLFQNNFKDKIENSEDLQGSAGDRWMDLRAANGSLTQKQNVAKATIKGVEVAGKYFILDNLSIKANYTYLNSENKDDDKPLTSSPKHMYSTTLDWQATSKLNTYLQYSGDIDRYRSTYTNSNGKDKDLYYKDFSIWNLGASYQFDKNFTLIGRVNNLFDKDYLDYNYIETVGTTNYYDEYNNKPAGRNFWLSARYTF